MALSQNWSGTARLITQTLTAVTHADVCRLLRHRTYAYRADGYITERRGGSKAPWSAQPAEPRTPGDRWRYAYDPLGRRISKHRVAVDGLAADRTAFL
ncbi:hypothetical protein ACWET9_45455 [Streptomyces sp. NPDC004059]